MFLGATYNVFEDAIEHLEKSIDLIRPHVDYINIVCQRVSNHGNKLENEERFNSILGKLLVSKKVQNIIEFTPDISKFAGFNEVYKRHIGMIDCEKEGCTHFILMDSDEYYISGQFEQAKSIFENVDKSREESGLGNLYSSTVGIQSYYFSTKYKYEELETYQVPFIYKIREGITFEYGGNIEPYICDPTRILQGLDVPSRHIHFKEDDIVMHHMTYVRENLPSKLVNSSARVNWSDEQIEGTIALYNTFKDSDKKVGHVLLAEGITPFNLNLSMLW